MSQINFRVGEFEKYLIQKMASEKGVSVAEFVKSEILESIQLKRVEFAFKLQSEGKITRKQTWKISGLSGPDFLVEWSNRGAVDKISDQLMEWGLELSKTLTYESKSKEN